MTMTSTEKPRPNDPTYRGQRRRHGRSEMPATAIDPREECWVLEAATIAEGLERYPVQLGPRLTAAAQAAAEDERALKQLDQTIRFGPTADEVMALERKIRPSRTKMTMQLGDMVIEPATSFEIPYDIEGVGHPRFADDDIIVSSGPAGVHAVSAQFAAAAGPVAPATGAPGEQIIGVEAGTGRLMARPMRGEWRLTMTGNFPSGSRKAKAKLAKIPRRYQLVFGFANSISADTFGGNELGTSFWQVLDDRTGWRGMRGLANSAVGSNRIGNGCLWRHHTYRCLDRAHFTIHNLPSAEFDKLDIPVVLLEDKESGAVHAEVQIHNFARSYSRPWERSKVVSALILLVNCLTDAGIPVIVRGDFNDSVSVVTELQQNTELVKVAPADRSIDMVFASEGIECRRPAEVGKGDHKKLGRTTDHASVTVVEFRVTPDSDTPRRLPRLPKAA